MTLSGPEHQKVRLPVLEKLRDRGWTDDQICGPPSGEFPRRPTRLPSVKKVSYSLVGP